MQGSISNRVYSNDLGFFVLKNIRMNLNEFKKCFLNTFVFKKDGVYPPHSCYLSLCERFNFITLKKRRIILSTLFLFKLMNFEINSSDLLNLINIKISCLNARH